MDEQNRSKNLLFLTLVLNILYIKNEIGLSKNQYNRVSKLIKQYNLQTSKKENYYMLKVSDKTHIKKDLSTMLLKLLAVLDKDNIPYDEITELIYNCKMKLYDDNSDASYEFNLYFDEKENGPLCNNNKKIKTKIETHFKLCMLQISKIQEESSEASEIARKAKVIAEDARNIKNSIYTDFIAILGIFSALIFGMFGGFDSLKEILSNLHNTSISTTLICFSSLMLGLLCLIFLLIQSIARITDRDTLSCSHHGNDKKCECSIIKKYPVFICSMLIFSAILIISCIIRFFDHNELYKAVPIYWIIAGIITIIIVIVLYGVFKTNKKKKTFTLN